jgi:hypothetical protein
MARAELIMVLTGVQDDGPPCDCKRGGDESEGIVIFIHGSDIMIVRVFSSSFRIRVIQEA